MKVLRFPLAKITLGFIGGILAAFYFEMPLFWAVLCFVVSFLGFAIASFLSDRKFNGLYSGILAILLAFTSGAATLKIHSGFSHPNNYIHQISNDTDSHLLHIVLRERLRSSEKNDRYFALVKSIDGTESSGKILVCFEKGKFNTALFTGSNLQVSGPVYKNKKPFNPDQFDYGQYLNNKSVLAQVYAKPMHVQKSSHIDKDLFYYADRLRNRILSNLEKSIPSQELAVIAALILGQQQDISSEVLHDYQFAGAVHILSVSGLHVGFILLFITFLLGFLPTKKWASYLKLVAILISLWGFAVLAGLSPSVIRSVTMFSFVAVGMHLGRKTNIFHTLLVSLLLILLFEPSFLFDVGFQLSYISLFFILWLQPMLSKLWQPQNKIVAYFWDILTVSFAAQIGAFPLGIYYFHQFPGLFFVTNLVIIPFLSLIMAVGVLISVFAAFGFVPEYLAAALSWSTAALNTIINKIASFDTFVIQDIPFNKVMLWSLYLLIVAVVFSFIKPSFRKIAWAMASLLLFQLSYFGTDWINRSQKEWIVFNARKSTLIAERNGNAILVLSNDSLQDNNPVQAYAVANFCKITGHHKIDHAILFNDKTILIVDSTARYPVKADPDLMLLRQSPKINLDRVLAGCRPKMIVADASNYKSDVALWQKTCKKQKIPFHAVAEKGFYILK